jgi:hypothetical protein
MTDFYFYRKGRKARKDFKSSFSFAPFAVRKYLSLNQFKDEKS